MDERDRSLSVLRIGSGENLAESGFIGMPRLASGDRRSSIGLSLEVRPIPWVRRVFRLIRSPLVGRKALTIV